MLEVVLECNKEGTLSCGDQTMISSPCYWARSAFCKRQWNFSRRVSLVVSKPARWSTLDRCELLAVLSAPKAVLHLLPVPDRCSGLLRSARSPRGVTFVKWVRLTNRVAKVAYDFKTRTAWPNDLLYGVCIFRSYSRDYCIFHSFGLYSETLQQKKRKVWSLRHPGMKNSLSNCNCVS
jgi:hypothetical protein